MTRIKHGPIQSHPKLLAAVLRLLSVFWECQGAAHGAVELLRMQPGFWSNLKVSSAVESAKNPANCTVLLPLLCCFAPAASRSSSPAAGAARRTVLQCTNSIRLAVQMHTSHYLCNAHGYEKSPVGAQPAHASGMTARLDAAAANKAAHHHCWCRMPPLQLPSPVASLLLLVLVLVLVLPNHQALQHI